MSHFSVLVIGDDVEAQLAPYHEFECTGNDDKYVQEIDKTEECLGDWNGEGTIIEHLEEYHGKKVVPFGQKPNLEKTHKYGYVLVDEDGKPTKVIKRTNPNKRWDWWVVGGRWSDTLRDSDGEKYDALPYGKISFKRMADDRLAIAVPAFEKALAKVNASGGLASMLTFDQVRETITSRPWNELEHAVREQVRKAYWGQPQVAALRDELFMETWEDAFSGFDLEKYKAMHAAKTFTFYAVVKNSTWHAVGTMGWFGISHDRIERAEWEKQFGELFADVTPETMITVVDCHI